jgi:hypothetical protein
MSSYRVRASISSAASEVTTKRGFALFCRCSLGDHAPLAAPAVERAPGEGGEAARGAALDQARGLGHREIVGDGADQALVAGEPKDVVDTVGLAPTHQRIAGKARVGPQQDLDPRPARPDLAIIRATSSTAPADASIFERLSLAASN